MKTLCKNEVCQNSPYVFIALVLLFLIRPSVSPFDRRMLLGTVEPWYSDVAADSRVVAFYREFLLLLHLCAFSLILSRRAFRLQLLHLEQRTIFFGL